MKVYQALIFLFLIAAGIGRKHSKHHSSSRVELKMVDVNPRHKIALREDPAPPADGADAAGTDYF